MEYIISPLQPDTDQATVKAKMDTAYFFGKIGFRELFLSRYVLWNDEHWRSEILGMISTVTKGDVVVFQVPTYADPAVEKAVVELVHKQGAVIIAFVHDVEYLRFPDSYDKNEVLNFLKSFDALIVGTQLVKETLANDGVTIPMIPSGPWGYRQPIAYRRPGFSKVLHYAGNFVDRKAGFLQNVPENIHIKVYGSADGSTDLPFDLAASVEYLGSYRQEELALALNDGYGLIWDENKDHQYDPYARINMTHKLSLYLSLGLPVVAFNQTAIGRYVSENGLGIAIDSLDNLANIIDGITEDDYNRMADKVASISGLIRSGRHNQMAALQTVLAVKGTLPF
ncbi:galactofuranosyltransferase [Lactobacillus rhamnosus]|uniref:Galactofuranosyltransferase n=1 Tax=Lacticaseibacillus rhamnosus TaxID=47715 RepID=A0A7Y7UJD8_LACRH|nr:galactofuranosyltransferase [Lacticaseibacillus rhamnosus]NVO87746.1 galactofuranosyltransferase [Lacticaseibacillus rhamnosus]